MDLSRSIHPSSHSGRRSADPRKRRIQTTIRWGRFWLLVIFALLATSYIIAIRSAPPARVNLRQLSGGCLIALLWDTAFLVGIWLRHNWARILLVTLLLITVVAFSGVIPMLIMLRPRLPEPFVMGVSSGVILHALSACLLLALHPIQRLSSRSFQ